MYIAIAILFLVVVVVSTLWVGNINPLPAKLAAARAYNICNFVSFIVGTKSVNTINVAVQLKDAHNQNVAQITNIFCYLASNPSGLTVSPTAPTSNIVIGTNGGLAGLHSNAVGFDLITNALGQFDINITQTAGGTVYYLVVCMPDGSILPSTIIQF